MSRDLLSRPAITTLVTGIAGAGKTTLLAELGAHLRARHRRVVTVVGIAELTAVPLGAFLPLLSGGTGTETPLDERLHALLSHLARDANRVVLFVDDAPLLDDISAAAVYQVIRAFGIPTVLTARTGSELSPALDHLRHEGAMTTHTLPALSHDEVAQLLLRRLGGDPAPDLINSLWHRTEGNPLFLRGLVEGALARTDPARSAQGVELDVDDVSDIGALADRAIRGLEAPERRAAQLLALAAGLGAREIAAAGLAKEVEQLQAAGLTSATNGRTRLVHPLIADAALRSLGGQRAERSREAAALLHSGDDGQRLAAVRLLLSAGVEPTASQLAEAAATAARAGDHAGCAELAAAAIAAGAGGAALHWMRGSALSLLGRLDEADEAFAQGWTQQPTPAERAVGISRHGEHLAFRRHDVVGALALADREHAALPETLRVALEPELRTWRAIAGLIAERSEAVHDPDVPPEVRLRAAMAALLADSLAGRGDLAKASALSIATIDREFGALDPVAAAMVHLEEFFAHLARANGEDAWRSVERQRSGPLTDAAGIWSYTLGVFCWYDGRIDEGQRLAALAVSQLVWRDPTGLLGAAVTLRALLAQAAGAPGEADKLLGTLVPAQLGEPRAAMLHAEYGALSLASAGQVDEAAALVAHAGGGAVDAGYGLVGALTLSLAIRLGRPAAVRDALDRAAQAADPHNLLLPALRDLAAALDAGDAGAVIAGARVVARAGMRATARDALGHVAQAPGTTAASRRRVAEALEALGDGGSDADEPTPREIEVAQLAAQRLSNAEIAAELRVSVRTVENHLTRYYAKTGATRRGLRAGGDAEVIS